MFLLLDRNNLGHLFKVSVFLDILWCRFLNLVLVVLLLIGFSNQKTLFLDIFVFVSALQLEGVLLQCKLSNFCHGGHKLIVHVHRRTGIYRLILYELVSL